jgi:hypothetical protein
MGFSLILEGHKCVLGLLEVDVLAVSLIVLLGVFVMSHDSLDSTLG